MLYALLYTESNVIYTFIHESLKQVRHLEVLLGLNFYLVFNLMLLHLNKPIVASPSAVSLFALQFLC